MRIASHQLSRTHDVEEALGTARRALQHATDNGIELVCFPECYIGGYLPNDREASSEAAYDVESAAFAQLLRELGSFDPTLVVGFTEERGSRLFNAAAVIRRGRLEGTYAKARPNEAFFSAGTESLVFRTAGTAFGINICNDANYPEVALSTTRDGAQGIVMPLNNFMRRENAEIWREKTLRNLTDRARDTGCWVVSSDVVGECDERISHGCTAIVSAQGEVLARVPENVEGVCVHDIN